jgi:hypothetical protein
MGEIHRARNMKAMRLGKRVDQFHATFGATIFSQHGIEHDAAIGVKAHPVVGEDRIGCMGFRRVIENIHVHARIIQRCSQAIEFGGCGFLHCCWIAIGIDDLKLIGGRRLQVGDKPDRTNHQDMACGLRIGDWHCVILPTHPFPDLSSSGKGP